MKTKNDYLNYNSNIGKWCSKAIEKEYKQNSKIYNKNGSLMFGASITVAQRVENSFNKTKDNNKKEFLSKCAKWMQKHIFD